MNLDVNGFYTAKRTVSASGEVTYETPKRASGVNKLSVTYNKSPTKVYEDGIAIYNRAHISDAQVTLDTHTMSLADKMDLFYGLTPAEDGSFEEGGDDDKPAEVAIGYPFKLEKGYLCIWWYKATAEPSDESAETSDDSGEKISPESIVFSCVKDDVRRKRCKRAICETEAEKDAFFASVLPKPAS